MTDLAATIAPKSDQLNADDLILGPLTIQVTRVTGSSNRDQPIDIHFEGDSGKPYKPCKSMRRVLVHIWGRDGNTYAGKKMTLFRGEKVRFGGVDVGGIRISHMSDIANDVTIALTASKASRKPYTVKPLRTEATPPVDPDVKASGDAAAKGGVESYKAWLASLLPEVKATVQWLHKEWSRIAKEADAKALDDIAVSSSEPTTEPAADFVDPSIHEAPVDSDEPDTELDPLESLRANVKTAFGELPKNRQKDLIAGREPISQMSKEELTALLAAIAE